MKTPDCGNVSDNVIKQHYGLVIHCLKRYRRMRWEQDDLESAGLMGLAVAASHFDPGKGCRFSTYAVPTIKGYLSRYLRDHTRTIHIPAHVQHRENLPQAAEVPELFFADIPAEDSDLVDTIALRIAIESLPERHRKIIMLHFMEGKTFANIGVQLGLSAGRVQQLAKRALELLREALQESDGGAI